MYLFTRSARLGPGRIGEALAWSVRITEKVNQISATPVSLWTSVFSPGVGTLTWSTIAEDLGTLEATDAKLTADGQYLELVDEGAAFASGDAIDDSVAQLLVADLDPSGTPPSYAVVVRAVLAPGAMAGGIELGIDLARRVKALTGRPCSFGAAATGAYGGVLWVTGHDSIEQLERAQQTIAADADFVKVIDNKASKLYLPGVTTQTVHRRIV